MLEVDGFDDVFKSLDKLSEVPTKTTKSIISDGLEEVLIVLKNEAPKDSGESAKGLDVQYVKTNNNGSAWGSCGIGKDNWEKTKALWFQNYGYENRGLNFKGEFITKNIGWMTRAFSKCKSKVYSNMLKKLSSEVDKAMKG